MSWKTAAAFLLAAALAGNGSALAWGPDGHAIVAQIAEMRLEAPARAKVVQLLSLESKQHLDEVASWADDYRVSHPETGGWHFVDIPLNSSAYNPSRDCGGGDCVVYQIQRFAAILSNPNAEPNERLQALKFVVHFVGDIHQPLHDETDFSRYPPPDGDRGGNKIHVSFLGDSANLHSLWDGEIIDDILGIDRPPHDFAPRLEITRPEAADLNSRISGIQEARWAPPGLAANLGVATIQWANGSHSLARTAYKKLPRRRRSGWEDTYEDYAWPVIQTQLAASGVRLARLLNESLR
jgi:S1/P1 Nuclease